jgi:ankyrin repeat protein
MKRSLFLGLACIFFASSFAVAAKMVTREQVLLSCAEKNNLKCLEKILGKGADVDTRDNYGWTALMHAANLGRTDVAKILLSNGAKLELRDNGGTTALTLAAAQGRDEMVTLLVEKGANINAKDGKGLDPLMMAAKGGYLTLTKSLLDKGANLHLSTNGGDSAVMLAAKGGHREVVNLLLARGAKIPSTGREGQNLIVAAIRGDLDQIKELVEKGAELDAKTIGGGRDAHFWAAAMGNVDVERFFLEKEAEAEPTQKTQTKTKPKKKPDDGLNYAAKNGKLEIVKLLLESNRDPNYKDRDGDTSLTLAAEHGHTAVVELILEHGADKNSKNGDGDSALILAVQKGYPPVVSSLLANGADIEAKDKKGKTALIWAVSNNDIGITTQLLEKKPKIDSKDNDGWPALHIAAKKGFNEITNLLCKHGSDINSKITQAGKSPLMLSSEFGHTETAKTLIENGASVNAQDNEGSGALFLAAEGGHLDTVNLLLDNGADFKAESKEGVTALMVAAYQGHKPVLELLIERGSPVDARSKKIGISALWAAAWQGKTKIIDYLWQQGADVNVKSKKGESPLIIAVENNQFDSVRMLLDKGVDQDIETTNRLTASELARKSGKFHLAWLINRYKTVGVRALGDKKGGLLGVNIQDLNESLAKSFSRDSSDGALVSQVIKNTPAEFAGLREGDIILRFNDQPVSGAAQLKNMIEGEKPDTSVSLMIFRKGEFLNITLKLAQRPLEDFYEAMMKYNPRSGLEYVLFPPTRKPNDLNYYLFQGKVYAGENSVTIVETPTNNYNYGRYWCFEMPKQAGFTPRVKTEVMVIGKIVDVLDEQTVIRKPLHIVKVRPVAIADASGKLLTLTNE